MTIKRSALNDHEHFRLLAETSSDVIARIDADFCFTYLSPSAENMFKRSIADTIGQSALAFIHPDDIPIVTAYSAYSERRNRQFDRHDARNSRRWHSSLGRDGLPADWCI